MSNRKNPWRDGSVAELIVKFQDMGARDDVKIFQMAQEILTVIDAIEAEDERRAAVHAASVRFRNSFSEGTQS